MNTKLPLFALLTSGAMCCVGLDTSQAADMASGIDYASPAMTSPTPASDWQVWGDVSLGLEYYANTNNYDEFDAAASGKVLFKSSSGFNIDIGAYGGTDFTHSEPFGGVFTDIFYANQSYALGVYGEFYANAGDYHSTYAGIEAAKFFSNIDVGGWAGWASDGDDPDYYEAGVWLTGYLTPNTALGGSVSWEGNQYYNGYYIGGRAEHLFADTNISAWTQVWAYNEANSSFSSWDARTGVRFFFGPARVTLQEYNHAAPF